MPQISSANFKKHSIKQFREIVFEILAMAGIELSLHSTPIIVSGKVIVYGEVGVIKEGIVYLCLGESLFLDSRLKEVFEEVLGEESGKIIYLSEFKAFLNHPNNLLYSLTEMAAIADINLAGKVILDLGCAEGILGLLSLKKGAKRVLGVDGNEEVVGDFKENLKVNGVREGSLSLLTAMFNQIQMILGSVPKEEIDVVFANIGPHFGKSDLEALELIKFLPNARAVIGAGYNLETTYLRPTRALVLLGKMGFKKNLRYFTSESGGHAAFIVER